MKQISWNEFEQVELRVARIIDVNDFPEARKAAYIIKADFGAELGIKKTSAQVCDLYSKEELVGKLVLGVVNLPPKQIGPIISEFLLAGFATKNGDIVLAIPDKSCPEGAKLH